MRAMLFICLSALIAGCGGVDLSTPDETRLTGDYHYLWDYDAIPPQLNIGLQTGESGYSVLITKVVAYGWTNGVIIAEYMSTNSIAPTTNIATYAVIKTNGVGQKDSIYTDLTYHDYINKRAELGIPDELTFTRTNK